VAEPAGAEPVSGLEFLLVVWGTPLTRLTRTVPLGKARATGADMFRERRTRRERLPLELIANEPFERTPCLSSPNPPQDCHVVVPRLAVAVAVEEVAGDVGHARRGGGVNDEHISPVQVGAVSPQSYAGGFGF